MTTSLKKTPLRLLDRFYSLKRKKFFIAISLVILSTFFIYCIFFTFYNYIFNKNTQDQLYNDFEKESQNYQSSTNLLSSNELPKAIEESIKNINKISNLDVATAKELINNFNGSSAEKMMETEPFRLISGAISLLQKNKNLKNKNLNNKNENEINVIAASEFGKLNLKEFKEKIQSLINGKRKSIKYVFLSEGHWTSGFIAIENNQIIFNNYNSAGDSAPIVDFFKTQNIFPKSAQIKTNIRRDKVNQHDGYFCGYCSTYNLEKEFFYDLGINYETDANKGKDLIKFAKNIDLHSNYELFRKQMYLASFFLNQVASLFGAVKDELFQHSLKKEDMAFILYGETAFEHNKQRLNDLETDNNINSELKMSRKKEIENDRFAMNFYSKYNLLKQNAASTKLEINVFLHLIEKFIDQDPDVENCKINKEKYKELTKMIDCQYYEIFEKDQGVQNIKNRLIKFIKNINLKLQKNKESFKLEEELDVFFIILFELKEEYNEKSIQFIDKILELSKNQNFIIKTNEIIKETNLLEYEQYKKNLQSDKGDTKYINSINEINFCEEFTEILAALKTRQEPVNSQTIEIYNELIKKISSNCLDDVVNSVLILKEANADICRTKFLRHDDG